MAWYNYFIIAAVLAGIGLLIYMTVATHSDNLDLKSQLIQYPFSKVISPNDVIGTAGASSGLTLERLGGKPQISCPAGKKLNITGAFIEVYDPYAQCQPPKAGISPSTALLDSCNVNVVPTSCTIQADCPLGTVCVSKDKDGPKYCTAVNDVLGTQFNGYKAAKELASRDSTLPDPTVPDYKKVCDDSFRGGAPIKTKDGDTLPGLVICDDTSATDCYTFNTFGDNSQPTCVRRMCAGLNQYGGNDTCSYGKSEAKCVPRDATAFLASRCNGKESCLGSDDPFSLDSPSSPFGPLPCNINTTDASNMFKLPRVNDPSNSNSPAKHGYHVHGIFNCEE